MCRCRRSRAASRSGWIAKTSVAIAIEGLNHGHWVVLDYDDVVVHIFFEPVREFYRLESNWTDGREVVLPEPYRRRRAISRCTRRADRCVQRSRSAQAFAMAEETAFLALLAAIYATIATFCMMWPERLHAYAIRRSDDGDAAATPLRSGSSDRRTMSFTCSSLGAISASAAVAITLFLLEWIRNGS